MRIMHALATTAVAVLLLGCTHGYKTAIGSETFAKVPLQHVALLIEFPPQGTYKVIGIVKSKGAPLAGDDAVYRKFKKAAADLGADAVVVGKAAMAYRGSLPGYGGGSHTSGYIDGSGYFSATTNYTAPTPPTPLYGLDVNGVAIRYTGKLPN